mgnify:CR=1 FL=1
MVRLFDVRKLLSQDMAISTDDGVNLASGSVFEGYGDERVKDAGFDGHDVVLVMCVMCVSVRNHSCPTNELSHIPHKKNSTKTGHHVSLCE